jgi:hypothetical protein
VRLSISLEPTPLDEEQALKNRAVKSKKTIVKNFMKILFLFMI